MSGKVVIFQELLALYPKIGEKLGAHGAETLRVEDGRGAVDAARQPGCVAVILDVAMPQMSGIEACRQIKEGALGVPPKIALFTSIESSAVGQRAQDAGCDLLVRNEEGEAPLLQFLDTSLGGATDPTSVSSPEVNAPAESVVAPTPGSAEVSKPSNSVAPPPRAARRVEVPGPVTFIVADEEKPGFAINASTAGMLFAADEELPTNTPVDLRFSAGDGEEFLLPAIVVRSATLKEPRGGYLIANGAKFVGLTEEQQDHLQELIDSQPPTLPKLKAPPLRELFDGGDKAIRVVLEGAKPELNALVHDVTDLERDSFSEDDPIYMCIRRLVVLRVQCTAYRAFLPTLQESRRSLAGPFLPYLKGLMDRSDEIENEVVQLVRDAVEREDEKTRQVLNEVSNRLYEAKTSLILAVDETLTTEGLGTEGGIVDLLKEKAEGLRTTQQTSAESVKFARRSLLEKKEDKKEKKKKKGKPGANKPAVIMACVMVGFFLLWGGIKLLGMRVSPRKLEVAIEITKVRKIDQGLVIHTPRKAWEVLPPDERDEVFRKVEDFLRKEKLHQAKIVDENERNMAALMYGRSGRKVYFSRKLF